MKKTLAIVLVLALMASALAGCGKKKPNAETPTSPTTPTPTGQAPEVNYEYRDLPAAKYHTPATAFAGGSGTEADPYQIADAAQLALLGEKLADSNYAKAYYVLTANIALNDVTTFDKWETTAPEYSWKPIGQGGSNSFSGVLDGKGFTISGLYINTNCGEPGKYSTDNYGLFGMLNGTVKNIKLDKAYLAVSGNPCGVGSIAGAMMDKALVFKCISNAVLKNYDGDCGGIVGKSSGGVNTVDEQIRYSKIQDSNFHGSITQVKAKAAPHIGGIVGACDGNVENCDNTGTISFGANNVDSVGGIAGWMSGGTVSACENTGALKCQTTDAEGLAIAGGIVGKVFVSATGSEKYMSRGAKVSGSANRGTVEGQLYAGGIVGQVSNDHNDYCATVSECTNSNVVSAKKYTGGVIGYVSCLGDNKSGDSILIEKCSNEGILTKGTVGGIIGHVMSETGNLTIDSCINSGDLTAEGQHCAGIVAYWVMNSKPSNCKITVDECTNTGKIASALHAGGIISFMDMPVCLELGKNVDIAITACHNTGSVSTSALNGYIGGVLGNWGMKDIPTTVQDCYNTGTLAITKVTEGISDEEAKQMTISRIAGGIIGRVGPGLLLTTDSDKADSKNVQAADAVLKLIHCTSEGKAEITSPDAKNIKNWFGGIIGNTCAEDGFSLSVDTATTYKEFDRGLGNPDLPDVGTKN